MYKMQVNELRNQEQNANVNDTITGKNSNNNPFDNILKNSKQHDSTSRTDRIDSLLSFNKVNYLRKNLPKKDNNTVSSDNLFLKEKLLSSSMGSSTILNSSMSTVSITYPINKSKK